jgi:WD40 repeat protein/GTPase SAR1 family protein
MSTPKTERTPLGFSISHILKPTDGGQITRIAWSPDGQKLACPSQSGSIRFWDTQSGKLYWDCDGHSPYWTSSVAWSPSDGLLVASGSNDNTIGIWDTRQKKRLRTIIGHKAWVLSVAWSPSGHTLASGSEDKTVVLWSTADWSATKRLIGHSGAIHTLAWSPDGLRLASGSEDATIRIWKVDTQEDCRILGDGQPVLSVVWAPNGQTIASSSDEGTIKIWDAELGRPLAVIEGHGQGIGSISFSPDGLFLASKSYDDTVRLWRTDTYQSIAILREEAANVLVPTSGIAFNPITSMLATLGQKDRTVRLWQLDAQLLLGATAKTHQPVYRNAKVVLVGDTGVGKSGLSLVLTSKRWKETGSTHGRRVWIFDSNQIMNSDGQEESRETLLWDLAGQPDYRLIHQLNLSEVAVALVVFDSRNQTDPFAGVRYWDRAIRQAARIHDDSAPPIKKFLVAARVDVGAIGISQERINELMRECQFSKFFKTSAKEGWQIAELIEAIRREIEWDNLPKVSSTELFQNIKSFLVAEKESGRLLSTVDDLYRIYQASNNLQDSKDRRADFNICIARVESRGLIQRLSFGNLVLLQPELRDAYASAMANTAKDEPDGLGAIKEETVKSGAFSLAKDERIKDQGQETLLIIATIEELLRYEIVLRENGEDGPYLIFPSQLTRENQNLPDVQGKAVVFDFEGAVLNIYATLVVRLSYSGIFKRKDMWKNAATFNANIRGTCGIFLRGIEDGRGELTVFFDETASQETRIQFEEYIHTHLSRKAIAGSIKQRYIVSCLNPECGETITDEQAKRRRERGYRTINCPVCDTSIALPEPAVMGKDHPSLTLEIDTAAEAQRKRGMAVSIVQGKVASSDFDVFLCHNSSDKPTVKAIGMHLKEGGILPWLDEWELQPGLPWQRLIEEQITKIRSAAVFVGANGIGPWHVQEIDALLREFADRGCPVIPVLLEGAPRKPKLPVFLKAMTWVDFRRQDSEPLQKLIWGITGERPRSL